MDRYHQGEKTIPSSFTKGMFMKRRIAPTPPRQPSMADTLRLMASLTGRPSRPPIKEVTKGLS
ncbi:hypothetical protein PHOBOS_46 [Erwinia phage vB_EamM_Phobos]|uniref:hypothetical protein n=1 Tax=Erwinia phage vB_EamM_Phobos TaxID=1883377 RepID=UPI00081CB51F|nr:hypothetical protein BIZ79_gp046 [Erwinia phage vB_EamM_Phobos]ANZ50236.1 hypothetical protein PHOBOS_46 [Erwinia phage vB_EamM_Phobos]